MSNTKYISVVDTAKLIRKVLKEKFPHTKFSVTSNKYSGGASIDIYWTDGIPEKLVKEIVQNYEGKAAPDITDYCDPQYAMLNGEKVKFGAHYVFTQRNLSDKAIQKVINFVLRNTDKKPSIELTPQNVTNYIWHNRTTGQSDDVYIARKLDEAMDKMAFYKEIKTPMKKVKVKSQPLPTIIEEKQESTLQINNSFDSINGLEAMIEYFTPKTIH